MTAKSSPELMLTVMYGHAVFKYISLSYLVLSLSNFHSNLAIGFHLINDNSNGCQNDHSLSFRICGNSNVLATDQTITYSSYMGYFYQTFAQVQIRVSLDMVTKIATACRVALVNTLQQP